jgi:UPF0755 protein
VSAPDDGSDVLQDLLAPRRAQATAAPTRTEPRGDGGAPEERRPRPEEPRRRRIGLKVFLAVVVVMLLLLGGAAVWLQRQISPSGGPGDEVRLEIAEGSSTEDIARLLEDEGVITSATIFEYYAKYKGADAIQAGEYVMRENSSMGAALAVLEAGPAPPTYDEVTIPEGLSVWASAGIPTPGPLVDRLDQAVDRFTSDSITQVLLSGQLRSQYLPAEQGSLEGMLFPDTYRIEEEDDEATVLGRMVSRFDEVAAEVGLDDSQALVGRTPYEVIVIASLIEREASLDEERAQVSRVIHNRLEQGIPLGIDASIAYAVGGAENGTLTASQLETDSPYNTRINQGLPPTPIAVPGRESLEAALHPADGPWLYYVLQDQSGAHFFTESYDEFLAAKERCQAAGLC